MSQTTEVKLLEAGGDVKYFSLPSLAKEADLVRLWDGWRAKVGQRDTASGRKAADLPPMMNWSMARTNQRKLIWHKYSVDRTSTRKTTAVPRLPATTRIISKATTPERDAYSGFENTDLHQQLMQMGVHRLVVGGLATDYCVLHTVMDACRLGYVVYVLTDAIRAVNVQPDDGQRAEVAMREQGAVLIHEGQMA